MNYISTLLNIGFAILILLPVFGIIQRNTQNTIAVTIAYVICLVACFLRRKIELKDKALLCFLAIIPLCIKYSLAVDYTVVLYVLIISLFYSILSREDVKLSVNFFLCVIAVASVYTILQFLGFESAQLENIHNVNVKDTPSAEVTSFLCHPIFVGALIAMFLPLALWTRKWWLAGVIAIAVLCTKSDMAIGSMVVSLMALPFLRTKKLMVIGCLIAFLVVGIVGLNFNKIRPKIQDSGRFTEWVKILDTLNNKVVIKNKITGEEREKKYNLLGWGAGSYKTFSSSNNLGPAHNEYLHCYFEYGIVGLIFFLLFLFLALWNGHNMYTRSAFLCICLNACGLFVWQIAPVLFASIFVLCLNKKGLQCQHSQ